MLEEHKICILKSVLLEVKQRLVRGDRKWALASQEPFLFLL